MAPAPPPGRKIHPDPIRQSSHHHGKLSGCGRPNNAYRYLHHQRGVVGTFHVRLLEGRGLARRHWSALSLGPVKHLGLSRAHGEVSSFGTFRLAFWRDDNAGDDVDTEKGSKTGNTPVSASASSASVSSSKGKGEIESKSLSKAESFPTVASSESASTGGSSATSRPPSFLPNLPASVMPSAKEADPGKSPLTPLFDQGCIRSFSPARSPFFTSHPSQRTPLGFPPVQETRSSVESETMPPPILNQPPIPKKMPSPMPSTSHITLPHHYARDEFRSSVVPSDSNPIWRDASSSSDNHDHKSHFKMPLHKDDLYPALRTDGGRVALEVRIDEDMAPTESLLVGGALSSAVSAASTVASTIPKVGQHAYSGAAAGMELLGLGKDRLIGRGYVDLMPLLLGLWEEDWEDKTEDGEKYVGEVKEEETEFDLDYYGKITSMARSRKRRTERMGLLDVWVPLYHPSSSFKDKNDTSGKVHLVITYEPNGMVPKPDDVVAFESFARSPVAAGSDDPSSHNRSVINPIVPPLSPLLVIDTRGSYLLLEYATSSTVTSVDRSGNVKSTRWERTHRVRIHRNAAFVIERQTLMDAAGNLVRMPGDLVLSTPLGREISEVSAPFVAATMELVGPALLWGKLMMAAGGTSVRAGLAGAKAATEAVVSASQEMALQNRERSYVEERNGGEVGVYKHSA